MSRVSIPLPKPIVDRAIAELVAGGTLVLESERNQPNGFLGLDAAGNIYGTITHRQGTAAEINAIILASGEMAWVTDWRELRIGNGTTAGGLLVTGSVRVFGNQNVGTSIGTDPAVYPIVDVVSVALGGVYRITGSYQFTGDTDSISNFMVSIFNDSCQWGYLSNPALNLSGTGVRARTSGLWQMTTTGTLTSFNAQATANNGAMNITPTELTSTGANFSFDMIGAIKDLDLGTGGTPAIWLRPSLRTARIGTPTILTKYGFSVERLR